MANKLKSNLCTIYFIRHGETDWNVRRKIQGHQDIPLNNQGVAQAKKIAQELKNVKFGAAYSSDLVRAKQTAEIISSNHHLVVETKKVLRERSFGKYEGLTVEAFRKTFQAEFHEYEKLPDREQLEYIMPFDNMSWNQILSRVINKLREIAIAHPNQNVLVTSHGGILRHLLFKMAFFSTKQLPWGSISNTAYIKLESDGIDFFLKDVKGITIHEN